MNNATGAALQDFVDEESVHRACAELRFAEALRRRSEEARTEASVQEAALLAWLEGARGSASELRELSMRPAKEFEVAASDPAMAVALGTWQAAWRLQSELPPLNEGVATFSQGRSAPAVLATLNRDVLSPLVRSGSIPLEQVAIPQDPATMTRVLQLASGTGGSVLTRTATVLRLLLTQPVFPHGNVATAFLFARWLLMSSGVEPTGVALLSHYASQNPNQFAALREAGTEEQWRAFALASVGQGARAGMIVARSVQAGKPLGL